MFDIAISWLYILFLMLLFNSFFSFFWFLPCFFYLIIVVWLLGKRSIIVRVWLIQVIYNLLLSLYFSKPSHWKGRFQQESLFSSLSPIPPYLFMNKINSNRLPYTPLCVARVECWLDYKAVAKLVICLWGVIRSIKGNGVWGLCSRQPTSKERKKMKNKKKRRRLGI